MKLALLLFAQAAAPSEAGLAAYREGRCGEAVDLLRQAASEAPRDARIRNNLGAALYACARYREAEAAFREALVLWSDRTGKASTHHNLAVLHRSQANMAEARKQAAQAVALADAAAYSHGLGEALRLAGDFEGARAAFEAASRLRATPEVAAAILQSRGALAADEGRLDEAYPLMHQAVAILEREGASAIALLGPKAALASVLLGLDRLEEAEPLLEWTLRTAERAHGDSHPAVAAHANNLAQLRRRQRRYAEAEPLYRRALEIWKLTSGASNPAYARGLHNLGSLFVEQGKSQGAEKLYSQALAISERAFGTSHPQTRLHASALADLYQASRREKESERLRKAFQ